MRVARIGQLVACAVVAMADVSTEAAEVSTAVPEVSTGVTEVSADVSSTGESTTFDEYATTEEARDRGVAVIYQIVKCMRHFMALSLGGAECQYDCIIQGLYAQGGEVVTKMADSFACQKESRDDMTTSIKMLNYFEETLRCSDATEDTLACWDLLLASLCGEQELIECTQEKLAEDPDLGSDTVWEMLVLLNSAALCADSYVRESNYACGMQCFASLFDGCVVDEPLGTGVYQCVTDANESCDHTGPTTTEAQAGGGTGNLYECWQYFGQESGLDVTSRFVCGYYCYDLKASCVLVNNETLQDCVAQRFPERCGSTYLSLLAGETESSTGSVSVQDSVPEENADEYLASLVAEKGVVEVISAVVKRTLVF